MSVHGRWFDPITLVCPYGHEALPPRPRDSACAPHDVVLARAGFFMTLAVPASAGGDGSEAGKRHYYRAFKNTNRKWGVPIHVQMAVIYYESSFQNRAKTPMRYFLGIIPLGRESSAFGYAQALDGTWTDYKKATGRSIARRSSIRDSADFMGWYMTKTRKLTGVSLSDAKNQYLAYHEGQVGYLKGSYKRKQWLINKAKNVGNRSSKYKRQLSSCIRT